MKSRLEKRLEKAKKRTQGFIEEFKSFALKKNVVDLAIAVVVGGAFGKIVTSLVNDIIMPLLSMLLGTTSFAELKIIITPASETAAEVAIRYGSFLQTMLDFLIIALCIFIAIKVVTRSQRLLAKALAREEEQKAEEAAPEPEPKLTKDQELLTEIVTLLKEEKQNSKDATIKKL